MTTHYPEVNFSNYFLDSKQLGIFCLCRSTCITSSLSKKIGYKYI